MRVLFLPLILLTHTNSFRDGDDPLAPDDGQGQPNDPPAPDDGQGQPNDPPSEGRTFTQAQVDRILQDRLERERKKAAEAKAEADRKAAAQAEQTRLAEEGKFAEALEKMRQEHQTELARIQQEREEHIRADVQRQTEDALVSTVKAKAVSEEAARQVVSLLSSRIEYRKLNGDNAPLTPVVLDDFGQLATNGRGGLLSVTELAEQFLARNAHFVRKQAPGTMPGNSPSSQDPPSSRNTGQPPANNQTNNGVDLTRLDDPEYVDKHEKQILRHLQQLNAQQRS